MSMHVGVAVSYDSAWIQVVRAGQHVLDTAVALTGPHRRDRREQVRPDVRILLLALVDLTERGVVQGVRHRGEQRPYAQPDALGCNGIDDRGDTFPDLVRRAGRAEAYSSFGEAIA